MIDVGGDNRPPAGHLVANELGGNDSGNRCAEALTGMLPFDQPGKVLASLISRIATNSISGVTIPLLA